MVHKLKKWEEKEVLHKDRSISAAVLENWDRFVMIIWTTIVNIVNLNSSDLIELQSQYLLKNI